MKQETNRAEKCYTNTDSISKSNNKDKPIVNNQLSNTLHDLLPGQKSDSDKKGVQKSHYKGTLKIYLMELGALMANFHYS